MDLLLLILLKLLGVELDDMLQSLSNNHVLNDIILSVQNNVSQLSKILYDILVFKITFNNDLSSMAIPKVGVLDKFLDDGIEYSVELLALG